MEPGAGSKRQGSRDPCCTPGSWSAGSAVRSTFEPHFLTQRPQASYFLPFLSCGMGITSVQAWQVVVTMRSCTENA